MPTPTITLGTDDFVVSCTCGWEGELGAITNWQVDTERDRLVRRCPECDAPRPEWGTFRSLDGVALLARGDVRRSLADAGPV